MTVKEMVNSTGLSQAAFASIYKIKLRTLEDWIAGRRTPPGHVYYLLERAVKYDIEHNNFLQLAMERQIEEARNVDELDEQQIIDNRFL